MNVWRRLSALSVAAVLAGAAAGCEYDNSEPEPPPSPTPSAQPSSLTIASAYDPTTPAGQLMGDVSLLVWDRSGRATQIVPTYMALAPPGVPDDDWDQNIARAVMDGRFDLAVVPARAWDVLGVDSFKALAAPFIIETPELMSTVARSDVAEDMLKGLDSAGVVALGLYPAELRWLVGENGTTILRPEDIAGKGIYVPESLSLHATVGALGGHPNDYQDNPWPEFASGRAVATESSFFFSSLFGASGKVATGNLPLFAEFNTLVVNKARFDSLSDAQRADLRNAAAGARGRAEAVAEASAAATAQRFCERGGSVVWAPDDGVAAFRALGAAHVREMEKDAVARDHLLRIERLRTPGMAVPVWPRPCGPEGLSGPTPDPADAHRTR